MTMSHLGDIVISRGAAAKTGKVGEKFYIILHAECAVGCVHW
jgi:hypothetical protein